MKRFILALILTFTCSLNAVAGWYNASWLYRVSVESQNAKVVEAVTNVYVKLDSLPAGFHTNVKAGGVDIRVTQSDGTTEVARDPIYDAGTDKGELHFDSTGIQTGSDVTWYIYYGNAAASDYAEDAEFGREAVYDANYKGVWHLGEGAGVALDSTSNDHDGTFNTNLPDPIAATVGLGQDLDGGTDAVQVADHADFNVGSGDWHWSGWVYVNNVSVTGGLISQYDAGTNRFYITSYSTLVEFEYRKDGTSYNRQLTVLGSATWYYVTYKRIGNTLYASINAGGHASDTKDVTGVTFNDLSGPVFFGDHAPTGTELAGRLDEIRFSKGLGRSDNWITTMYNNQGDVGNFWSIGAEEAAGTTKNKSMSAGAAQKIIDAGVKQAVYE